MGELPRAHRTSRARTRATTRRWSGRTTLCASDMKMRRQVASLAAITTGPAVKIKATVAMTTAITQVVAAAVLAMGTETRTITTMVGATVAEVLATTSSPDRKCQARMLQEMGVGSSRGVMRAKSSTSIRRREERAAMAALKATDDAIEVVAEIEENRTHHK